MGMSYRRAWLLVDTMNRCFAKPMVETHPGEGTGRC
jgi:molybdate transport system regulatory protein